MGESGFSHLCTLMKTPVFAGKKIRYGVALRASRILLCTCNRGLRPRQRMYQPSGLGIARSGSPVEIRLLPSRFTSAPSNRLAVPRSMCVMTLSKYIAKRRLSMAGRSVCVFAPRIDQHPRGCIGAEGFVVSISFRLPVRGLRRWIPRPRPCAEKNPIRCVYANAGSLSHVHSRRGRRGEGNGTTRRQPFGCLLVLKTDRIRRAKSYTVRLRFARYAMPNAPRPKIAIEVGSGTTLY